MTDPSTPDRLSLIGMRFEGRHGVRPDEKVTPQPFEVDVVLHADLSEAAERDDLAATIDYSAMFDLVRAIVEGRSFDLIEALAGAIARAVLAATRPDMVEWLTKTAAVFMPFTPEEFGDFLRGEIAKWRKISDATGIKAE